MSLPLQILGFLCCAALIVFGGSKLSRYGTIIAELSGIGKAWFGLVLMAAVTSLPELLTGVSSVLFVDSPDVAVGGIMGSCVFNLLLLAVLDYFIPRQSLLSLVAKGHLLAVFGGIFLITVASVSVLFADKFPTIGWISTSSFLLLFAYIAVVVIIFKNEQRQVSKEPVTAAETPVTEVKLHAAIMYYIGFAVIVVLGGIFLPYFADGIAGATTLSRTFVGSLFVAAATSLPELAVSISAVKIKSYDIAVGNMLGSNLFNIFILVIVDVLYQKGPLLQLIDPIHALSALTAVLMSCVVGATLYYSPPVKRFLLGVDDAVIIALYAALILVLM